MTPLDYLKSIYLDEEEEKARRIDAAKAAAPYVHAKLSSVAIDGNVGIRDDGRLENDLDRHIEALEARIRTTASDQAGEE